MSIVVWLCILLSVLWNVETMPFLGWADSKCGENGITQLGVCLAPYLKWKEKSDKLGKNMSIAALTPYINECKSMHGCVTKIDCVRGSNIDKSIGLFCEAMQVFIIDMNDCYEKMGNAPELPCFYGIKTAAFDSTGSHRVRVKRGCAGLQKGLDCLEASMRDICSDADWDRVTNLALRLEELEDPECSLKLPRQNQNTTKPM